MYHEKRFVVLSTIIIICCCCNVTGCAIVTRKATSAMQDTMEVHESADCVPLSTVQPPEFGKRFAILYSGKDSTDVYWGYTDDSLTNAFFWTTSSYPGFNYTVLVQDDYFTKHDSVSLSTLYGEYVYKFSDQYDVYQETGELINKKTGAKVNVMDPDSERLVIYSSATSVVYEYVLEKGTKIKIE